MPQAAPAPPAARHGPTSAVTTAAATAAVVSGSRTVAMASSRPHVDHAHSYEHVGGRVLEVDVDELMPPRATCARNSTTIPAAK